MGWGVSPLRLALTFLSNVISYQNSSTMVRFNSAIAILGLTLSNAMASITLDVTSSERHNLQEILNKLDDLEIVATMLEEEVSELERHRKLEDDCGFELSGRGKKQSCRLRKTLEVDEITFNDEATFEDDVEMEGSGNEINIEGSAIFYDDVTIEGEFEAKKEAVFGQKVLFNRDVKMKKGGLVVEDLTVTGSCRGCD